MKAIVLAGGYATRLRPISYALPKLLFPVLGKPMIFWTLDLLNQHGVDEVVLGVNYLAEQLRAKLGERYKRMRIRYSLEDTPLGTAGPIKLASKAVRFKETFLAMNGDVIADINLAEMKNRHEKTKALVTDALHHVPDPRRFGVVQLRSDLRIQRFVEKPLPGQAPSRLVNAGIYLIEPEVLRMIRSRRKVSLEREIFPILARKGKLSGFPFTGFWFDIGDLTDYQTANFELLRSRVKKSVFCENGVKLSKDAKVRPPIYLGRGTRVEANVSLGPFVLVGGNVFIGRGSSVSNSILFDGVRLGERSVVSGSILASNVKLGKGVRVGSGVMISPEVRIRDNVTVGKRAVIHPYKEIETRIRPGVHAM